MNEAIKCECGKEIEKLDETPVIRCPECQAKWRIEMAKACHDDPMFAWYYRASRRPRINSYY